MVGQVQAPTVSMIGVSRYVAPLLKNGRVHKPHMFRSSFLQLRNHSTSTYPKYDVGIVGGGIVGLGVAQELTNRHPKLKVVLMEKERELALHQTGNNSGVIHAGIYYKPGSLMAKLCVEGLKATYEYCDKYNIPYKKLGKLIVATNKLEVERLDEYYKRATLNGVPGIEMIDAQGIKEREPLCTGIKALWSPETGNVDWGLVARHYGKIFLSNGGTILTGFECLDLKMGDDSVKVSSSDGKVVNCDKVLGCAGLYSDRVAKLSNNPSDPKVLPFRGEYWVFNPKKAKDIRGNIYPTPDPNLPFVGVHFTPRMNGDVWIGPNAVLGLSREGYSWWHINLMDLKEVLLYPGFYKLGWKNLGYGLDQMLGSIMKSRVINEIRKIVPDITVADITPGPTGVMAVAMGNDGNLIHDFILDSGEGEFRKNVLHVRNAPSPAATSSLSIAKLVVDRMEKEWALKV